MSNKSESLINCSKCKSKKSRCSRELPACSYCSERGIKCIYPDQIRRRGVGEAGLTSFITKINVRQGIIPRKRTSAKCSKQNSKDGERNILQLSRFVLFQTISRPINFVEEDSQEAITKIHSNGAQKFQTHILLILSTQIIDYDKELIPQIGFFVNKLELGVFGGLLRFSIHMSQEWIAELLDPSFEEKCISSYFQSFHLKVAYLSKYKFYTSSNVICPVLKSVLIFVGYSSISKQRPELLKYLKHLAIVQLKKNMFNIRVSICQALFIFSYYLLFQGLGKQSLGYFHQAYLMASTLGIHKDMPGLNEMDTDERRCIRFASQKHDYHLCGIIRNQPYCLFLGPIWKPLNPQYQTNPYSKDPNEFLVAECICLSIKCFNMYWIITGNLISKYSELAVINPSTSYENNTHLTCIFETLLSYSLIRTLDLHLNLSMKCKNPEELEIVKNFAKTHVQLYHSLIIVIYSQFSPPNPTVELDQSTKKQLWSAQALYRNAIDVNPLTIPMLYHNLCSISLLYIKLILIYNHVPEVKELFLGKLKQVYELFNNYKTKYNMPTDIIEVINIIVNYYRIKV